VFRRKPADLSDGQQRMLDSILALNAPINTAYLLKEQLRQVYWLPYKQALALSDAWRAPATVSSRRLSASPSGWPSSAPRSKRRFFTGSQTPASSSSTASCGRSSTARLGFAPPPR